MLKKKKVDKKSEKSGSSGIMTSVKQQMTTPQIAALMKFLKAFQSLPTEMKVLIKLLFFVMVLRLFPDYLEEANDIMKWNPLITSPPHGRGKRTIVTILGVLLFVASFACMTRSYQETKVCKHERAEALKTLQFTMDQLIEDNKKIRKALPVDIDPNIVKLIQQRDKQYALNARLANKKKTGKVEEAYKKCLGHTKKMDLLEMLQNKEVNFMVNARTWEFMGTVLGLFSLLPLSMALSLFTVSFVEEQVGRFWTTTLFVFLVYLSCTVSGSLLLKHSDFFAKYTDDFNHMFRIDFRSPYNMLLGTFLAAVVTELKSAPINTISKLLGMIAGGVTLTHWFANTLPANYGMQKELEQMKQRMAEMNHNLMFPTIEPPPRRRRSLNIKSS